jgi:hypothetical protein
MNRVDDLQDGALKRGTSRDMDTTLPPIPIKVLAFDQKHNPRIVGVGELHNNASTKNHDGCEWLNRRLPIKEALRHSLDKNLHVGLLLLRK